MSFRNTLTQKFVTGTQTNTDHGGPKPPLRTMIGSANKRKRRGRPATNTMTVSIATETEEKHNEQSTETIAGVSKKDTEKGNTTKEIQ